MEGIRILRSDHELIQKALFGLVAEARRVAEGVSNADTLSDLVLFFQEFADKHHHAKEEQILFPALEAAGFPQDEGPLGVMHYEHHEGRKLLGELAKILPDLPARADSLVDLALSYQGLLERHIFKENNILFEMARRHLDRTDQRLIRAFERAESALSAERRAEFERLVEEAATGGTTLESRGR